MTIFFRPLFLAALALIFVLAFLFGGPDNPLDISAIHRLMDLRRSVPLFTSATAVLTQLGSVYATMGLGLVAAAFLVWQGERGRAALLIATVLGERLVVDGLKIIVGRPRPWFDEHPVMTHSSSFPSGHSANTMAVFVTVALIAAPAQWRGRALAVAITLSVAIGLTRPFLGVHWPSDVVGGWALGLLMVAITLRVGRHAGVIQIEAKHDVVGGHRLPSGEDEAA